jgi:hypothetical protein
LRPLQTNCIEFDDFARIADYHGVIGHVFNDHCARTNRGPLANPNPLNHTRAQTNVRALTYLNASGKRGVGRQVYEVRESAIVFNDRTRIDDTVIADDRVSIDYRVWHHSAAITQLREFANTSARVDQRDIT